MTGTKVKKFRAYKVCFATKKTYMDGNQTDTNLQGQINYLSLIDMTITFAQSYVSM